MKLLQIIALAIVFAIVGCTTPINKDGYSKPTVLTQAPSYLKEFPLGTVSKKSLIENIGIPTRTNELEGKVYYSYELGEGYGLRQFVYEITNGMVTDVRYHDQGPYNGMSAKKQKGIK